MGWNEDYTPKAAIAHHVTIYGDEKKGKTHFALMGGWPEPLWIINADRSMDHFLTQLPKGSFRYLDVKGDIDNQRHRAQLMCEEIISCVKEACSSDEGTLIIDGFSRVWDLMQDAYLPDDPSPRDYAKPNSKIQEALSTVIRAENLNMVLTNRSKDIWLGATRKSEKKSYAGYKDQGYYTQWIFEAISEVEIGASGTTVRNGVIIKASGFDRDLEGHILFDPNYQKLDLLAHKDTSNKEYYKLYSEVMSKLAI